MKVRVVITYVVESEERRPPKRSDNDNAEPPTKPIPPHMAGAGYTHGYQDDEDE